MLNPISHAAVLCCIALAAAGAVAQPQNYPNKPIRMVIPWPLGGPTDMVGRIVGQEMTRAWGQQVIVDNRPGASGMIGADVVAKAAPNGYTILMAYTPEIVITQSLFKSMTYDPVKDLAPVILVATAPMILVTHPSLPAKNVKELVALAKSRPGQLPYASAGNGSPQHLAGELLKSMAGIDMVHVPYKGAAPALADLLGGHVVMYFSDMLAAMPHVKAGKLRAVAVSTAKRSPAAPDSPEQFGRFIQSEIAKFARIIKESGARGE